MGLSVCSGLINNCIWTCHCCPLTNSEHFSVLGKSKFCYSFSLKLYMYMYYPCWSKDTIWMLFVRHIVTALVLGLSNSVCRLCMWQPRPRTFSCWYYWSETVFLTGPKRVLSTTSNLTSPRWLIHRSVPNICLQPFTFPFLIFCPNITSRIMDVDLYFRRPWIYFIFHWHWEVRMLSSWSLQDLWKTTNTPVIYM